MDISQAFSHINWLSAILAAASSFVIGGVWYGPLFGRAWMAEWSFTEEVIAKRNMPLVFGGSLALALLASVNLAMFLGSETSLIYGATAGFFAGLGWVAMFLGILYLFEMRSLKLFSINAGYCTLSLTTMGAIIGAW